MNRLLNLYLSAVFPDVFSKDEIKNYVDGERELGPFCLAVWLNPNLFIMMMIMVRMKMMMMVMEKAVLLAWLLVHWLAEPKLVPRFWSSAPTIHHTEESWKMGKI